MTRYIVLFALATDKMNTENDNRGAAQAVELLLHDSHVGARSRERVAGQAAEYRLQAAERRKLRWFRRADPASAQPASHRTSGPVEQMPLRAAQELDSESTTWPERGELYHGGQVRRVVHRVSKP